MRFKRRPKVVIWGTGGHALVVADIVRLEARWEIAGFLNDMRTVEPGETFCGAPILGGKEQVASLPERGVSYILFGFGNGALRLKMTEYVQAHRLQLATAVHPRAIVARDVTIGRGTVIAAGAVVNPSVSLGENVIVNTASSIDHECVIEEGAHICPGVHLAGNVYVGRRAWIGIGSTVKERVRIGANTLIWAGSVVLQDIPDNMVAFGVPAEIRRTNL